METASFSDSRLLAFARRLQAAESYDDLVDELCREIRETLGYQTAWISIFIPEERAFKVMTHQGAALDDLWMVAPLIPIDGDPYVSELFETGEARVIEDAQVDPRVNREIVEQLGNRTVVNVPMTLIEDPFGMLGTGTFGDEGVRLPTDSEMAYLHQLADHMVVASARILLRIKREDELRRATQTSVMLARRQRLESLGELAGGVAHDFNNLLTVIRAAAQSIREETDPLERDECLQMIENATTSAAQLTERLLALGHRQQLQMTAVDAKDRLQATIEMLRRVMPANIAVKLMVDDDLPAIFGDAGQIDQVLVNLCVNARDAMTDGGELTIDAKPFEITDSFVAENPWARGGHYVLIEVSDTGYGMTPETLERIFEPFFTTKDERHGTGLGLAVTHGIVEQHGGLIHAYSDPGVGTTIRVYLPASDEPAAQAALAVNEPAVGGTERVLVADDQDDVRSVIERVLTRAGYTVVAVSNGLEAVEAAAQQDFDLAVLDAVMPEMSGRMAYEKIRERSPGLRAIFVSGYGGEELTTKQLRELDVPLLHKPFDPAQLLRLTRSELDRAGE